MTFTLSAFPWLLAVLLAPLLTGVVNRTKAFFGGRHGQPFLQVYYDLYKLMRKSAVYSRTSTWIFRLSPPLGAAVLLVCLAVVPAGPLNAPLAFKGDFIFLAYALGLMRFTTVLAALDAGSSFEGMGAAREVQFALLAEVALLSGLAVPAACTNQLSISGMYERLWTPDLYSAGAAALLASIAFFIVLLTENARIPVDDPTTHLELTMIHEVMVLDHCGIDLAFIEYASTLKLWLFASLFIGLALPLRTGLPLVDLAVHIAGVFLAGVVVGVIESCMARLRLVRVPQLLTGAIALSLAAFFWTMR